MVLPARLGISSCRERSRWLAGTLLGDGQFDNRETVMIKVWPIVLALAGLAACQSGPARVPADEAPFPVGSRVYLHQDLPLAVGQSRVYVQHGRVSRLGAREFSPYCRWRVLRSATGGRIPAGVYAVARSWMESGRFVQDHAGSAIHRMAESEQRRTEPDGSRLLERQSDATFGVLMDLIPAAAAGPAHYRLICAQRVDPSQRDRYPTIQQIQRTVDGLITVERARYG